MLASFKSFSFCFTALSSKSLRHNDTIRVQTQALPRFSGARALGSANMLLTCDACLPSMTPTARAVGLVSVFGPQRRNDGFVSGPACKSTKREAVQTGRGTEKQSHLQQPKEVPALLVAAVPFWPLRISLWGQAGVPSPLSSPGDC